MDDNADYQAMLDEFRITDEQMWEISNRDPWYLDEDLNLWVQHSAIHGMGLFVGSAKKDSFILATCKGKKLPAGRFVNHSAKPNAYMVDTGEGNILLVFLEDVEFKEVTIDYRATPGAKQLKLDNLIVDAMVGN